MSWTDERVEMLKAMWAEGKSASQIAKELGAVTRNAVIGKVHRLGLSNRGPGSERPDEPDEPALDLPGDLLPEPEADPDPAKPSAAPSRPALGQNGIQPPRPKPPIVAGQPIPPQPVGAEMSAEALANLAEVAKKAKRLTLMQLTERTCKWPIGDPATDNFWFCGLPCVAGKPYCETHVAVAFQPMSARRDRRAGGR
jgi:GcrA cell cycle regulator